MSEKFLAVDGLTAGYIVGVNVSLFVRRSDGVTMLGRRGAGESTLIRTLSGLLRTRAGTATLGANELSGAPPDPIVRASVATLISDARKSFVEVLEHSLPLLFTRHTVREDSAGPGAHRGGFGGEIGFDLRKGEADLTVAGDRSRFGSPGVAGAPGKSADHTFHTGGCAFKSEHLSKIDRLYLRRGDGVRPKPPGGGYGPAEARDPAPQAKDIDHGLVHDGS